MKYLFLFSICCSLSITSFAQRSKEYSVIYKLEIYDTVTKRFLQSGFHEDDTVLCFKNFAIRRFRRISIHESPDYGIKREVTTLKYFLMDLQKRIFYDYTDFSTSANYLGSYKVTDTMSDYAFGYFFWGVKDSARKINIPRTVKYPMPDTLMNNIRFKREYCFDTRVINNQLDSCLWILYYRYDIKNTIFHYDFDFDRENELPLCRFELRKDNLVHMMEVSYERFKLTRKERQVFKAWIRNAKKKKTIESDYVPEYQ